MTIITAGADANVHFDPTGRWIPSFCIAIRQVLAALFPVGAR